MNEKGKDRDCDNKNFYWGIVDLRVSFKYITEIQNFYRFHLKLL